MARINIYLPDDLASAAKEADLNLSAVAQEAVRAQLAAASTDAWLEGLAAPSAERRVTHDDALEALDASRDETATRHG